MAHHFFTALPPVESVGYDSSAGGFLVPANFRFCPLFPKVSPNSGTKLAQNRAIGSALSLLILTRSPYFVSLPAKIMGTMRGKQMTDSIQQSKESGYWSHVEFLELRNQYLEKPSESLMDELITRFFKPLADGYWSKYRYMFPRLDEDIAKPEAITMCWIKFDRYDPAKGTALNFFSKIVQRVFKGDQTKEELYNHRYINASSLDLKDE